MAIDDMVMRNLTKHFFSHMKPKYNSPHRSVPLLTRLALTVHKQ
jgi:hypothetical protein